MEWIIDTDGGIDDCQALVVALEQRIIALTTVHGNTSEENVYKNIREVRAVCERTEIPIYRGAKKPLLGENKYAAYAHGESGLGHYWEMNQESISVEEDPEMPASLALLHLRETHTNLGLICLGPLTNLAASLLVNLNLTFEKLYLMAGTSECRGNITNLAEFNVYCDPEAAAIVFERCRNIVMIPWEPAGKFDISNHPEFLEHWFNEETRKGRFVKAITQWALSHNGWNYVADLIAVAVAFNPDVVESQEESFVKVETSPGECRGFTVLYRNPWPFQKWEYQPNSTVVLSVDFEKIKDMAIKSTKNS